MANKEHQTFPYYPSDDRPFVVRGYQWTETEKLVVNNRTFQRLRRIGWPDPVFLGTGLGNRFHPAPEKPIPFEELLSMNALTKVFEDEFPDRLAMIRLINTIRKQVNQLFVPKQEYSYIHRSIGGAQANKLGSQRTRSRLPAVT